MPPIATRTIRQSALQSAIILQKDGIVLPVQAALNLQHLVHLLTIVVLTLRCGWLLVIHIWRTVECHERSATTSMASAAIVITIYMCEIVATSMSMSFSLRLFVLAIVHQNVSEILRYVICAAIAHFRDELLLVTHKPFSRLHANLIGNILEGVGRRLLIRCIAKFLAGDQNKA